MQDLAIFAWREFIALNWVAMDPATTGVRGRPNVNVDFVSIKADNNGNFPLVVWRTRKSRVRPNLGSGCEPECLHFIGVLSFDDEFREDVGWGGIQEKFRHALAQGIGHDQL